MYVKGTQIGEQLCTLNGVAEFTGNVWNRLLEGVLLGKRYVCTRNTAERLQIWLWSENVSRSSPTWWMKWKCLFTALVMQIFRHNHLRFFGEIWMIWYTRGKWEHGIHWYIALWMIQPHVKDKSNKHKELHAWFTHMPVHVLGLIVVIFWGLF